MPDYHVTWEIDVDADSAYEAAVKARETQMRRIAQVFEVREQVFEENRLVRADTPRIIDINPHPDQRLSWLVRVAYRTVTTLREIDMTVIARDALDAIECGAMLVRRRKCVVRIDSVRTVGRPVHVWQATEAAAVEQRQQAAGTP